MVIRFFLTRIAQPELMSRLSLQSFGVEHIRQYRVVPIMRKLYVLVCLFFCCVCVCLWWLCLCPCCACVHLGS